MVTDGVWNPLLNDPYYRFGIGESESEAASEAAHTPTPAPDPVDIMSPLLAAYNTVFETAYTVADLEGVPLTDPACGIYSAELFRSLGSFLAKILDKIYRSPQLYWGVNAQYMYRAVALFVAVHTVEGADVLPLPATPRSDVWHQMTAPALAAVDDYDMHHRCKYVDNVTTLPDHVPEPYVLASACAKVSAVLPEKGMVCMAEDIVTADGETGMGLTENAEFRFEGGGRHPALFVHENEIWMACRSPDLTCVGLTPFDRFEPTWFPTPATPRLAPLVKNGDIHLVLQHSPLTVVRADPSTGTWIDVCRADGEPDALHWTSNLVPLAPGSPLYIGALSENSTHTRIGVIDTETWKVVDLSHRVAFPIFTQNHRDPRITALPTGNLTTLLDASVQVTSIQRLTPTKYLLSARITVDADTEHTIMFEMIRAK
jgi:hypothetical protein